MAHIGEKPGFGQARRLRFGLGRAQFALGPHLCADIARGAAIAAEFPRRVENRLAADRNRLLGVIANLSRIDKFAKRLPALHRGPMIAPFLGLAAGFGDELPAGAAEAARRILAERAD